ncbi:nucleobase-ascorbate transporter 12-like isoform X1 [Prosopis cineraria]|uniref:nucleobase-ascorbate transporter 12-like isoform X1 n=1 Tax=Prosopis cineraria TaxID=364024 RepID=UPI00240F5A42|nr:nucleobase-ascorbate transporter 12-like isoform X1 [Prosopis cineraria]
MSISEPRTNQRPRPQPPEPDNRATLPSSWAKRTGFKPKFSGETNASDSGQITLQPKPRAQANPDLEAGRARSSPVVNGEAGGEKVEPSLNKEHNVKFRDPEGAPKLSVPGTNAQAPVMLADKSSKPRSSRRHDQAIDVLPQVVDESGLASRQSRMKYELRDSPGLVPIGLYGMQHYISMFGSLIVIPLVIVPAMGGAQEDTSAVVSTVLFMSGVTTLLHTTFGSRLPLVQGPSFVYLAPALAIINSPEFQGLNGNKFKHIMKELQGAIIIGSAFQALLGYTGLMSFLARLINPMVVCSTVAAVGLSFYSYGFPVVGKCLEIGVVQILVVIVFSLHLRKISVLGHRVFLIFAVPLGLAITWATAFLLTEAGAYSYEGCDINIPASNMVSYHCRKHVLRMKHCRVDTSHALKSSPWFRFPYPLQWGTPVFHWKMAAVMCVVSLVSSVDSVGSYHASSLLVASRPPTPGVLSRGIGLEGLSSLLAGLWGTGTGFTTLTENVHTIAVTKMGSRRAVELGACFLIVLSLVGKVGGFIASIPEVIVAALLCFMCAMLTALGLSNLRYSEAGSSRNVIIIGLSLFLSLSVAAYFEHYGIAPNSNLSVPSYFQPYIVASHGPFQSRYAGLNYVGNTLLSQHMVTAFVVAVILDNTVPGSMQERGVYDWTEAEAARSEPSVSKDYGLPFRVGKVFRWVKWVGL